MYGKFLFIYIPTVLLSLFPAYPATGKEQAAGVESVYKNPDRCNELAENIHNPSAKEFKGKIRSFSAKDITEAEIEKAGITAAGPGKAEDKDSLTVVKARWTEARLAKGIVLKQFHFKDSSLFGSNQFVSILEIDVPRKNKRRGHVPRLDIVARESLTPVAQIAREENAAAAVNGSFFASGNPYNSVDYLRVDGTELAPNVYKQGGRRQMHQLGALVTENGRLHIFKADSLINWENTVRAEDMLTSGPLLCLNGKDEPLQSDPFYTRRHPRTAVGKTEEGKIFLIVVDGRSPQAAGMSLKELQSVFRWLGVRDLLNLDGGGSSTLYIRPDLLPASAAHADGVVNHPTDNRQFDHHGARPVANAIIVTLIIAEQFYINN